MPGCIRRKGIAPNLGRRSRRCHRLFKRIEQAILFGTEPRLQSLGLREKKAFGISQVVP